MGNKYKNGLFVALVLLLTLPAIQHKFRFFKEKELSGHFVYEPKPTFSWDSWMDGSYQFKQQKYLNEKVGFRPGFVRLRNEMDYDLFNVMHSQWTIQGKEGLLFEASYVASALGQDFIGEDSIRYKVKLLRQLQDQLNKNGVKLLFVIAPGKGIVYKELLPDSYLKEDKHKTNYAYFLASFKEQGINFIDFQGYTNKNAKHAKYALLCKTGIHWSQYMEYFAGDSLFRYLDARWGLKFPRSILEEVKYSPRALDTDEDIESSLNLLHDIPDFNNMGYPYFHFDREAKKSDPQVLAVADSFYWGIYNKFSLHLNNPTFWYYYREQYAGNNPVIDPKTLNLKEELLKRKVVIMLFNDSNLKSFGYGFIEDALKALE